MPDAFICAALRTPIGRYGGALATVRADDLAALPIKALLARHPGLDPAAVDDVVLGCANQAGEDNRNVARMAALLAGLPASVPGATVNRLCGSGMEAVGMAARAIRAGEAELLIAGGVESMSRAPFVLRQGGERFLSARPSCTTRRSAGASSTPGSRRSTAPSPWPRPAENVAAEHQVAARRSGRLRAPLAAAGGSCDRGRSPGRRDRPGRGARAARRAARGRSRRASAARDDAGTARLVADAVPRRRHGHGGQCLRDQRWRLRADRRLGGRGAAQGLEPLARIVGMACAGVAPRVMGIGPVPATRKLLARTGLQLQDMAVIELNEAFATQALAVLRELGLPDDADHVNPNGGAIALGHPLGMSGARLVATASYELGRRQARYALCTMCIGVGQGIALIVERISRRVTTCRSAAFGRARPDVEKAAALIARAPGLGRERKARGLEGAVVDHARDPAERLDLGVREPGRLPGLLERAGRGT